MPANTILTCCLLYTSGLVNGGLLGIMALVFLGIYVHMFKGYTWLGAFAVSGCVGVSLLVAMAISSLVGTVIPMFFHKIKIDPVSYTHLEHFL